MWDAIFQPTLIAVLVVIEVAVWQVRVALATRGRKQVAALLGAVNAVLSVAAIGQVVTNLTVRRTSPGMRSGSPPGCISVLSSTRGSPVIRWPTGSPSPAMTPRPQPASDHADGR